MSLRSPHQLELTYTQAMMACLLLNPNPTRVLVIGLGGGSLVKFLLHHFPNCQIEVVEYRNDVIRIAKQFFHVPMHDQRLTVRQGDGYLHVKQCFYEDSTSYDLVLVDAYDHSGMAASVGVQAFFDACSGILNSRGVMSINLWGSDRPIFNQTMQRINQSFGNRSMILPVENKGNVIALASQFDIGHTELKKLRPYVEQMELQFNINLPKSLQNLIRQNRNFISRLFA